MMSPYADKIRVVTVSERGPRGPRGLDGSSATFMSGTWEELQAAGAAFELPNGAIVECTDWPGGLVELNSYWRTVVLVGYFTAFAPLSGEVLIGQTRYSVDGVTTEEAVGSYGVPANMCLTSTIVFAQTSLSKSDAINSTTLRVYIGENGDNTDSLIHDIMIPAEDRSATVNTKITFTATDKCVVQPADTKGGYDTSLPIPAPVSIPAIDTTYWKLTFTLQNADAALETVVTSNFAKMVVL